MSGFRPASAAHHAPSDMFTGPNWREERTQTSGFACGAPRRMRRGKGRVVSSHSIPPHPHHTDTQKIHSYFTRRRSPAVWVVDGGYGSAACWRRVVFEAYLVQQLLAELVEQKVVGSVEIVLWQCDSTVFNFDRTRRGGPAAAATTARPSGRYHLMVWSERGGARGGGIYGLVVVIMVVRGGRDGGEEWVGGLGAGGRRTHAWPRGASGAKRRR